MASRNRKNCEAQDPIPQNKGDSMPLRLKFVHPVRNSTFSAKKNESENCFKMSIKITL